ncbi:MAG: glutaminase [Methylocella sp.]|jgi:glutaminase
MMIRPDDSHDLRLHQAALEVDPAPAKIRWAHDVFNNSICLVEWSETLRTKRLRIVSTLDLTHHPVGPVLPACSLDPTAELFPFSYAAQEIPDVSRLAERQQPDPTGAVDAWARRFVSGGGETHTLKMLEAMTHAIKAEFRYGARHEEGTQTAAETPALGSGVCRDFAVLMMEALRSRGLAARFVTGYLYTIRRAPPAAAAARTPGAASTCRERAGWSMIRPMDSSPAPTLSTSASRGRPSRRCRSRGAMSAIQTTQSGSMCASRSAPCRSRKALRALRGSAVFSMKKETQQDRAASSPYVSTGHLPPPEQVKALVSEAYERFRLNAEGANSEVYPALANAPRGLFGVCVVGTSGNIYEAGDTGHEFPIMSVSKPFVFALVCQSLGAEEARERLGVNATGLPFNALEAIERDVSGRTNPMVNPGAIATSSLVPGSTRAARWRFIEEGLSRFAGRALALNEDVCACAAKTNFRNREIARRLQDYGRIYLDPVEATDLYTRQCSLNVSVRDLAVMGATLADGGVNPLTRERVIDGESCKFALAVMVTAGLYETSGDWLYDVR